MNQIKSLQILQASGKKIFTLADLEKLLLIKNSASATVAAGRLIKHGILTRIAKGYFILAGHEPADFELANTLYPPSYISLESALNYYGILIQSPQQMTSVTAKRTKRLTAEGKAFSYAHLDRRYFTNYERVDNFLIATPEKALVDTMFFVALGRASLSIEELNLQDIDRKKVKALATKIRNQAFKKYFASIHL